MVQMRLVSVLLIFVQKDRRERHRYMQLNRLQVAIWVLFVYTNVPLKLMLYSNLVSLEKPSTFGVWISSGGGSRSFELSGSWRSTNYVLSVDELDEPYKLGCSWRECFGYWWWVCWSHACFMQGAEMFCLDDGCYLKVRIPRKHVRWHFCRDLGTAKACMLLLRTLHFVVCTFGTIRSNEPLPGLGGCLLEKSSMKSRA